MAVNRDRHDPRPLSCDTLVAFPDGSRAIFGKNSDRGCYEAQPLDSVPATAHPAGTYVRCQYLTIPQVGYTLAVLGSRPWWLWGFEQGVNEAGVAIGNEAIYTRDEVPDTGLLGMDLVRLGLERGSTAAEARDVIIRMLERYGQGGNAVDLPGYKARYQNSFIIADATEAYVLETSSRHWVWKRVKANRAIANLVTIEDDWDDASDGIDQYARDRGWWWGPSRRKLNFRAAYEDPTMRVNTEDRFGASCLFLAGTTSASVEGMMRHLRDHFEGGTIHIPETPEAPRPRSVCCHPGRFASATAASMVVELRRDSDGPPIAWCSMAPPCTSVFLPVPVGAALPTPMVIGGELEDTRSLWWAMRELADAVDADPGALAPIVQDQFLAWEAELIQSTTTNPKSAAAQLGGRVDQLLERRARLLQELAAVEFQTLRVAVS